MQAGSAMFKVEIAQNRENIALGRTLATDVSDTDTSTFFGTIFFWHWLRYQYWHQTKWKIPRISRDQDVILYVHWEASLPPEKMIFCKTS